MLDKITLKNFKSYVEAEVHLSPLTFFIGTNASGKSNALEAIRVLSWLAKGQRLSDVSRLLTDSSLRGQPKDLFNFQSGESFFTLGCSLESSVEEWKELSITLSLQADDLILKKEEITQTTGSIPLYEVVTEAKAESDEIIVAYNNFKKGGKKPQIPCSNRQSIFYQLQTPSRFGNTDVKSQKIIPEVNSRFIKTLQNITFLDPHPSSMRGYSYAQDNKIHEDGSNLSSVLYSICSDQAAKEKVLSFIRSLPEQDIYDIEFIVTDRKDIMISLVESFGNQKKKIDAPLLSDGTLRVLAIAATLMSAKENSLVVIEEIDNGVHPSRAQTLINEIKKISLERSLKVLITSHNPALLNVVEDSDLENVLCAYRSSSGASKIARLADLPDFPEITLSDSLGNHMTRRTLEVYLKKENTKEKQKEIAKEWLTKIKNLRMSDE